MTASETHRVIDEVWRVESAWLSEVWVACLGSDSVSCGLSGLKPMADVLCSS